MFYCDPVFAFVGMRQLLMYKHLLARRATCAVYGRFFCHLKGTMCIHISNAQLPCSYCVHGADVHGGGDQTLEKLEIMENSENFKFDFMWNRLWWPYWIYYIMAISHFYWSTLAMSQWVKLVGKKVWA